MIKIVHSGERQLIFIQGHWNNYRHRSDISNDRDVSVLMKPMSIALGQVTEEHIWTYKRKQQEAGTK
jgi:hypothetical protein